LMVKNYGFPNDKMSLWLKKCAHSITKRLTVNALVPNFYRMSFSREIAKKVQDFHHCLTTGTIKSIESSINPAHLSKVCYFISYGIGLIDFRDSLSLISNLLTFSSYGINSQLVNELGDYRTSSEKRLCLDYNDHNLIRERDLCEKALKLSAALRVVSELRNFDDHTASLNCHGIYSSGTYSWIIYDFFNLDLNEEWDISEIDLPKTISLQFAHNEINSRFNYYGNYFPEKPLKESLRGFFIKVDGQTLSENNFEKLSKITINKINRLSAIIRDQYKTRQRLLYERYVRYHCHAIARAVGMNTIDEWEGIIQESIDKCLNVNIQKFKELALLNADGLVKMSKELESNQFRICG
jgi:hypothetical protein